MIRINRQISIDDHEIALSFIRASGPGGQNVNAVATAVQLRFKVAASPSLPAMVKKRLTKLAGRRITADGELVINAQRYRTQGRNREDAIARLCELIGRAAVSPKARRPTQPSAAAKRRRLEAKRRRSATKRMRGTVEEE